MITSIVASVVLVASAQSTGRMSPGSDLSGNPVRATGGASKSLRDWAAFGPVDATSTTVTAAGATTARRLKDRFSDVFNVKDYGAKCDATWGGASWSGTDDTAAIQAALTAAGTAGGGTVFIPTGACLHSDTLLVPSKVRVVGSGRRATRLVANAAVFPGKTVEGSKVYASIAMAAVTDASVTSLTVDHTAGASSNGILCVAGNAGAGTRSYRCTIEDCEVLFSSSAGHSYAIWSMKSDDVKIVNNHVDGGFTSYTTGGGDPEEGIEVYGGEDVLVQGNTVKNVQANAIYVWSDSTVGPVRNVRVLGNYVETSARAVSVVPVQAYGIHVRNNQAKTIWDAAFRLTASATSIADDIVFAGNSAKTVGDANVASMAAGVWYYGDASAKMTRISFDGNALSDVGKTATAGITIYYGSNIAITRNRVLNSAGYGVYANNSSNLIIDGNYIESTAHAAIQSDNAGAGVGFTRGRITNNELRDYDGAGDALAGAYLGYVTSVVVDGNSFIQTGGATKYPIYIHSSSDSIHVGSANKVLMPYTGNPVFRYNGTNPSRGTFTMTAAATTTTVSSSLLHVSTPLIVIQTGGTLRPFTLSKAAKQFTLSHAAAAGDETFEWLIP